MTSEYDQLKSALDRPGAIIPPLWIRMPPLTCQRDQSRTSVVAFDSGVESTSVTTVQTNNTKAAEEAAQHADRCSRAKSKGSLAWSATSASHHGQAALQGLQSTSKAQH